MKSRNLVWFIPLLGVISYPLWHIPIKNFLTPRGGYDPAYASIDKNAHNFRMDTVTIIQNNEGRTTAIIHAATAHSTAQPNEYILKDVCADIFNKTGETTNIVAKQGILETELKTLTLKNEVVVSRVEKKQQLFSDLVYYTDTNQHIECPGNTQIQGQAFRIDGSSLLYDISTNSYELGGRVHGIIEEGSPPPDHNQQP